MFFFLLVVGGIEVPFKVNIYDDSGLSLKSKSQIAMAVSILIWIIAEIGKYYQEPGFIFQAAVIVSRMMMIWLVLVIIEWWIMIR